MPQRLKGFSPSARKQIRDRAEGRCERCNQDKPDMQIHHRRPRGMGGSRIPGTNLPANGLYLCSDCHTWIERNRANANENGQLVPQFKNPAEVPVLRRGSWVMLFNDGDYVSIPEPATGGVA